MAESIKTNVVPRFYSWHDELSRNSAVSARGFVNMVHGDNDAVTWCTLV